MVVANFARAFFHKKKVAGKCFMSESFRGNGRSRKADEEPTLAAVEIGQPFKYMVNMDIQDINVSFALIGGSLQDKKQHKQVRPLPI